MCGLTLRPCLEWPEEWLAATPAHAACDLHHSLAESWWLRPAGCRVHLECRLTPFAICVSAALPECSKVQTVQTSDSPQQVLEQLQQARLSQLPVIDSNGNLVSPAFCSIWKGVWAIITASADYSKYRHHHHPLKCCRVSQIAFTLAPHSTETLQCLT